MHIIYKTKGVCSSQIEFDYEYQKVFNISFCGGCNGNLKALAKVLNGRDADYIVNTLKGNTCGFKPTSCADQLALAIEKTMKNDKTIV